MISGVSMYDDPGHDLICLMDKFVFFCKNWIPCIPDRIKL